MEQMNSIIGLFIIEVTSSHQKSQKSQIDPKSILIFLLIKEKKII